MFHVSHDLFQPNFLSQIEIVDLVYCLTNLLFFDIPLWYFNINFRLCWSYIPFLRYSFMMLILNYFLVILLWSYWDFCNSISNFIANQITRCFCCFLILKQFSMHMLQIVKHYQEVSGSIYLLSFCLYCLGKRNFKLLEFYQNSLSQTQKF